MTRLVAVLVTLTLSCAPAPGAQQVRAMPDASPLVLALETGPGPALRAVVRNASSSPQKVLVAPAIQPVDLLLEDASGAGVERANENARRKFDRTVYRDQFETVAPGDTLELQSGRASRGEDGRWSLRFGPWSFGDLPPGDYTLLATWTSAADAWTDRGTGKRGTERGVWKGTLAAPPVSLTLP